MKLFLPHKGLPEMLLRMFVVGLATAGPQVAMADDPFIASPSDEEGYSVAFIDDPLSAPGVDATAPMILMRARGVRTLLITPRVSFVSELRKSVEDM